MTHETATTWLKAASIGLIVVGVYFSWALYAPLNAATLIFLDIAMLAHDGPETLATVEARLLTAIVGGLTAGIGVAILMITRKVYAADPALGGQLILAFAVPWFCVDSIGSILAGAWFNVVPNLVIFAAIAGPVLLRRKSAELAA